MYTYLSQAEKIGAIDRPTRIKSTKKMLDKAVNFVGQQDDSIAVFKVILIKAENDKLISKTNLQYHIWDQRAENNHTATCDFMKEIRRRLDHVESRVDTMEGQIDHIGEALLKLSRSIRKARQIQAVAGFMGAVLNAVTFGIAGSAVSATMNATLGSIVDFSDMGHIKQVVAESALDANVGESVLTSTANLMVNAQVECGMNKFDESMKQALKNLSEGQDRSPLVAVAIVAQLTGQVTGYNKDEKEPCDKEFLNAPKEELPNTASMNLQSRINKISRDIKMEEIDFESMSKMNKISAFEEQMYGEKQEGTMKIRLEKLETDIFSMKERVSKLSTAIGVESEKTASMTLMSQMLFLEEDIYGEEIYGSLLLRVKTLEDEVGL